MPTRTFNASWLNDNGIAPGSESGLVVHGEREGIKLRCGQVSGKLRIWSVIFRCDGSFWEVTYEEPDSRSREHFDPWAGRDEVEAVQVEPVMTPAILWKSVGESTPSHPSTVALNAAMKAISDENVKLRKDVDNMHFGLGQAAREAFAQRKRHKEEMLRLHPEVVEKALMQTISVLDHNLHKHMECDEGTGKNWYPETVSKFLDDLAVVAKKAHASKMSREG